MRIKGGIFRYEKDEHAYYERYFMCSRNGDDFVDGRVYAYAGEESYR